jgi:DNA-binding CsgD family transcriptional regulator
MVRPQLRERGHELGRTHSALVSAATTGVGRVLVVTGEPGIGKTALLDAVRQDALELGFAVGSGKADEVNQITPGAPVLLALRNGGEPVLDEAGFRSLAPLHEKPLWLVDQVAELLEVRAQQGPVLIVLDDLQWADRLSQFLVRAVSGRLIGSPVVWVLAARTSPGLFLTGPDAASLFEGAPLERLTLSPLSDQAVLELATELLGDAPAGGPAALLASVGGNPFLVVQLCQGLVPQQEAAQGSSAIPFSVVAVLDGRLSALDLRTVELIELAAVWGVPLPFAAARGLLGGSGRGLLEQAQHAASAGWLRFDGDRLAFGHDLLRQFVYDGLDEDRRATLHAACTRYLLGAGGSAADAVPHARIAAAHGDPAGVELLRRAARECRTVTPLTAALLMQEAFAATPPTEPRWQEIGEECAELLSLAQRGADVAATVDVLLARPHSAELEARLQVLAGRALWLVGQVEDMERRTSRALSHPGMSKPLHSRLQAAHALALSRLGPMGAATSAAEAALDAGRSLGDQSTTALALQALGEIAKNEGRHLAAYRHFRELRILAGPANLPEEIAALQFIDRFDEAEALLVDAEQRSEGDLANRPSLACARLWQDFKRAHFDVAATDALTLLRIGDELGTYVYRIDAHMVLSTIAVIHGDLVLAETLQRRAEDEAGAADPVRLPGLMLGRARIAAARGDVDGGVTILRALVDATGHDGHTYWPRMLDQARLYAGLAVAAAQPALADEAVELAETAARNNPGVASFEGVAQQVHGFVHHDVDALEVAVGHLRKAPRPMMLASALTDYGSALVRSERTDLGFRQLEEALAVYTRLEAKQAAAGVRDVLAAAGVRSDRTLPRPARPRSGWTALTESERKVAELVSTGLTNRGVARTLHVSTNTVGTHLRSVFTKLDVQSRVQLTNALHDELLNDSPDRR